MWGVARVTCLVAIITVVLQSELPHAVHELHLSHPGLAILHNENGSVHHWAENRDGVH